MHRVFEHIDRHLDEPLDLDAHPVNTHRRTVLNGVDN